jgi:O-antigen/teichoic acid export membrane protein
MFAAIQDDNEKLKSVYRKIMQQVLFWVSSTLFFLGIMATPLFRLLFSEKWLPAVPYFQILCLAGILYPLHAYNLNILNVKGRSDLFFRLEIVKKIMITVGLFCALPFGIYGLLYMQVIFSLLAFFVNTFYSGKFINYPAWEQLKDIFPVVFLAFTVGVALWLFNWLLLVSIKGDFWKLLISATFYFSIYLGTAFLIKMAPLMEFKQIILKK